MWANTCVSHPPRLQAGHLHHCADGHWVRNAPNFIHLLWLPGADQMDQAIWDSVISDNNFWTSTFLDLLRALKMAEIVHSSLFRQNDYTKHYIDLVFELLASVTHPTVVITATSFLLGMCLYINAMVHDMKQQIDEVEAIIQNEQEHTNLISMRLIEEIMFHCQIIEWGAKFTTSIGIHSTILCCFGIFSFFFFTRLADSTKAFMSATIFYQLLMCATCNAVQLFMLESNNVLSFEGIVSIYLLLMHMSLTYACCYLSESVTANLTRVGDIFFDFPWYQLPIQQQKLIIMPIQRSNRPFYFDGFGLVDCSLQTFLSVIWSILCCWGVAKQ